jgi:hypothetical protein
MVLTSNDIVKYKYSTHIAAGSRQQGPTPAGRSTVNTTFEHVALIERERERRFESDRLARLAARVRACCDPSLFGRLARALRGASPAGC